MLKKGAVYLFLFQCLCVYSQQLEEDIYVAAETFIKSQNSNTLQLLNEKSEGFKRLISSKDEQVAFVFLQCNKAYYLKGINNVKEAIIIYEDAWKRYSNKNLSGYDIIDFCLKPLGELYTVSKDYKNAENIIKQYIFLAEKNRDSKQKIAGIINLSVVYNNIGSHNTAIEILKNALKSSQVDLNQKLKLQNNLALNLMAASRFEEAQIILDKNEEAESSIQINLYKNISQLAALKGDFEKAKIYFEKAKNLFFKQKEISARMLAKLYVAETRFLLTSKTPNKALKSLRKAIQTLLPNFKDNGLPTKEMLYAENTFIDIFDLLGDIQINYKNALESYDLSFYVAEILSDNISYQATKILNQIDNRKRSEKCIRLLYENYLVTGDEQIFKAAFLYAEKSKASVLKEMVQKKSLLHLYPNDDLLIKEQELSQKQERVINTLINGQLNKTKAFVLNDLSNQLTAISIQLKSVKNEISKKHPSADKRFISIDSLQNLLGKDKAILVEYFYGNKDIYQFKINSDKISFFKIEFSDDVKILSTSFVNLFNNASAINNDIKNYTNQAFKLYKSLHLSETFNAENLIIIPDGMLNFVPFESLLTEKTDLTNFSKMPFLIKNKNVVYNSSAAFYMNKQKSIGNEKLLGVFPVFKNTNQHLSYSVDEAKSVKKETNSTLFMHENATKSNFIEMVSDYGFIHLSTHANSGNYTNPASISFYDQPMLLNELYSLDLNPHLVVLSACETGVGKLEKGEGAMSIARGFQYAGAQNILFTLWRINDKSTSKLMQLFYQNYNNHKSIHKANRESKLDYLEDETISNLKKSPYYWSAFVYYGTLKSPKFQNDNLYFIGFGILIILIFLGLKLRRKRIIFK